MAFAGFHSKSPTAFTYTNSRQDADLLDPADVVSVPSYSRWFSRDGIHECEVRALPEFFREEQSASKNPEVYKHYRNAMVRNFRENPNRRMTFTETRKSIVGDVGSIRRIFEFLEERGLINHFPPPTKGPPETAFVSTPAAADVAPADATTTSQQPLKKRVCGDCKCVCSFSCFTNDKLDLTLCARCYVNQKPGVNISEFRRVEISDVVKNEWTDKETLILLEAVMHYGDDWKKVADRVPGRNDKECVARFLKLPSGEQFVGTPDSVDVEHGFNSKDSSFSNKRMRLTPLADASNPIMAQAAFLSALVGAGTAKAAAKAAVEALSDIGPEKNKENPKAVVSGVPENPDSEVVPAGETSNSMDSALNEAQLLLEKEEADIEKAVSDIIAQIKEIKENLVRFEKVDLEVGKELQHTQQLRDGLSADQLTSLFNEAYAERTGNSIVEID